MKIDACKVPWRAIWVASFAEAWIENQSHRLRSTQNHVASFAEAWIEKMSIINLQSIALVASFAEAWIEKRIYPFVDLIYRRLLRGGVD